MTILFFDQLHAQSYLTIISDRKHLEIVSQNGAMRSSAENTDLSYLATISSRLSDIGVNVSSVLLLQDIIHRSLTQVDGTLKNGIAVQRIVAISTEIIKESNDILKVAKADPELILFAEEMAFQVKQRSIKLVLEVSQFVLHEGKGILMDYGKRDALLNKILLELRVIRAQTFSVSRSLQYAKLRGLFSSLNPFRAFINRDRFLARTIVHNIKLLEH